MDHAARKCLNDRQALGRQAESPLLQLQGVSSLFKRGFCGFLDVFLGDAVSYLLSFSSSGPKWTDSSGLVWWSTKHLSQSWLCEKSWIEGHRHVERQQLGLQQWTGGPSADCSDVECTVGMLAPPPQTPGITAEHTWVANNTRFRLEFIRLVLIRQDRNCTFFDNAAGVFNYYEFLSMHSFQKCAVSAFPGFV